MRHKAAAIVKLTPSNQESLHESAWNEPRSCSDCQIDPPEIKNHCTKVHGMNHIVAAIAKSGPEIKNHCSTIVAAAKNGPPAEGRCRYDAASDSNFRRRKVE